EDYMSTQVQILQSEDIALQAAQRDKVKARFASEGGFSSFPEARKPEDLVPGIFGGLTVTRDNKDAVSGGGNNILLLTFPCTNREEAKIILECLVEAYDSYIADVYKNLSENVVKDIERAAVELEKKIRKADDEYLEYLKQCPVLITKLAGGMSLQQKEYNNLT